MVAAEFLRIAFVGRTFTYVIVSQCCHLAAFLFGVTLFRRTWIRECWSGTRTWAGLWLTFSGLSGIFLTLSLAFANYGPPTRDGYAMIITIAYGDQFFWFFGGIILTILGIALIGRSLYLRTSTRL